MNLLNVFRPVNFLITLLCCSIFLTTSPLRADEAEKTVLAMGIAIIQGENLDGAKQNALENALRNALEQGVDMVMDATTILEDDELLEKIYTHSRGAITRHEIIKERESRGQLEIKIKVWINTGTLTESLIDLGIIQPRMDNPRVLVLPAPDQPITRVTIAAETMLIKQLTDKNLMLLIQQRVVNCMLKPESCSKRTPSTMLLLVSVLTTMQRLSFYTRCRKVAHNLMEQWKAPR